MINLLRKNRDAFAWALKEMLGIDPNFLSKGGKGGNHKYSTQPGWLTWLWFKSPIKLAYVYELYRFKQNLPEGPLPLPNID
ncbi:hypothetical protein CR513_38965, partial [Mucuna pruriens]